MVCLKLPNWGVSVYGNYENRLKTPVELECFWHNWYHWIHLDELYLTVSLPSWNFQYFLSKHPNMEIYPCTLCFWLFSINSIVLPIIAPYFVWYWSYDSWICHGFVHLTPKICCMNGLPFFYYFHLAYFFSTLILFVENARMYLCRIAFSIVGKGEMKRELPPAQVFPLPRNESILPLYLGQVIHLMEAFESRSDQWSKELKCLPPAHVIFVGFPKYQEGEEL